MSIIDDTPSAFDRMIKLIHGDKLIRVSVDHDGTFESYRGVIVNLSDEVHYRFNDNDDWYLDRFDALDFISAIEEKGRHITFDDSDRAFGLIYARAKGLAE